MSAAEKLASLKLKLDVVKGPHAGKSYEFSKPSITLGRGVENDIVFVNDPLISRQHVIIELIEEDFVVRNLSEKNALYADGQSVEKWQLTNGSHFKIGDTEIEFTYDLGQAVRTMKPQPVQVVPPPPPATSPTAGTPLPSPVTSKPEQVPTPVQTSQNVLQKMSQKMTQKKPLGQPSHRAMNGGGRPTHQSRVAYSSKQDDASKRPFYILIGVVILVLGFILLNPTANKKAGKRKPAMKYEDEIEYNLRSEPEKKLEESLQQRKELKNSPQALRAEENFIRGMRDFNLGNYARAADNFQVVLNLDPEHVLAKRYMYLSKVRFDELLQTKLMLGESNYQKHNFSMCESYYQQVLDMLQVQTSNPKYTQAQSMVRKCQLAQEGIR